MTTLALPTWPKHWEPQSVEWNLQDYGVLTTSPTSQDTESLEFPGARWLATITYPPAFDYERAQHDAFWSAARGRMNRIQMPHLKRMRPRGTLTGPVVLGAPAAAGATVIAFGGAGVGGTALAGDMLGIGSQVVMIGPGDAPNLSNVPIAPPLRTAQPAGTPVVYAAPLALFVCTQRPTIRYAEGQMSPAYSVQLLETFA